MCPRIHRTVKIALGLDLGLAARRLGSIAVKTEERPFWILRSKSHLLSSQIEQKWQMNTNFTSKQVYVGTMLTLKGLYHGFKQIFEQLKFMFVSKETKN